MEISIKVTEEMLQEAFQKAMQTIETDAGVTLKECVEKQIPKKPKDIRYFGEAGYYIGLCPSCNGGNNSEYQYCGDCGQKLDWSEEK